MRRVADRRPGISSRTAAVSLGPDTLQPADSDACDFAFGPYRLIKHRRRLLDGNVTVRMGGRAFDLLLALVERASEVVTRRELEA